MHKYLAAIFNHKESYSCVKLSLEISQQVFQHVSKQGQRKYIPILINDEDVQSSCLHFIYTMGERIIAEKFQNYVQNNVLPHVTSSRKQITQPIIFLEDLPPDDSNYIFHGQPKGIQQ
ncbi:11793_t:CDS:2, partial [Dentiscutata heterogama]